MPCTRVKNGYDVPFDLSIVQVICEKTEMPDNERHVSRKRQVIHVENNVCFFQSHRNVDMKRLVHPQALS